MKDKYDKSTGPMVWEESIDKNRLDLPLKGQLNNGAKVGSGPNVPKDALSELKDKNKQQSPVKTKEQFKIEIQNQNGEISDQLTELTETDSGTLAMELEEHIVELIEEQSKTKPYLYVSVKTTDSGHMLVGFDTENKSVPTSQRVTVRRTPSGTKLIDIHKDIIKKLKKDGSKETHDSKLPKSLKLPEGPKENSSPSRKQEKKAKLTADKEDTPSKDSKEISVSTLSWKSGVSPSEKNSPTSSNKISPAGSSLKKLSVPDGEEPKKMTQIREDENLPLPIIITETSSLKEFVYGECDCPPTPSISFNWTPKVFVKKQPRTQTDTSKIKNIREKPIKVKSEPGKVKPSKNKQIGEYDCACPRDVPPLCCTKPDTSKKEPQHPIEKTIQIIENHLDAIKPECQCILNSPTSSYISATSKSYLSLADTDYTPELNELYKQGNVNVNLKVRNRNGIVRKLDAAIKHTPSGTLAIYGKDTAVMDNITFDKNEYTVLLTKTVSDAYFVGIGQYDRTLNAVLRKTPSGGLFIIPKSKSQQMESRNRSGYEDFFKIKVTGVRNYPVELPAVLKTTPSENYIILLDKEFEKRYKETVKEYVGEKRECIIDLTRSPSGSYVIHLDTNDINNLTKKNALLVKSSSGNIKVLVRGPEFETMVKSVSKRSSTTSSQAFGKLVSKLPASSREFHREHLRKSKYLDKKSSSDTQLYDKVRMQLKDKKCLLSEPSAVLKKTASGQYAIILNKESKKSFINNLQSYLNSNSQGLIPIKRTESGEIIILLNSRDESKRRYGSLRITASGNIFVMVDEATLKGLTKAAGTNEKSGVVVASSMVTDLVNPNSVNKSVTTTCHDGQDKCLCDTSKCVCAEMQPHAVDWLHNDSAKKMCSAFWNKAAEDVNSGADNYCAIANGGVPKEKSPHIVIKPGCDCAPVKSKRFGAYEEQCFYVFDTICPYHKDRYNGVSNELLEITGLCNQKQEELNKTKFEFIANNDSPKSSHGSWNSLNYLPPQLPPFLKDVNYR